MIEFDKTVGVKRYQVRTAGASVRLYTDGVFHTQWNPNRVITGSIWDLLAVPAFQVSIPVQRVLILGVGGGAAVRQFEALLNPERITGIELDKIHLQIARRFFGLYPSRKRQLVHADAVKWVKNCREKSFDIIVDDLFGEENGIPQRAVTMDNHWCRQLKRLLTPGGMVLANFDSLTAFQKSREQCRPLWPYQQCWWQSGYDNRIGVFSEAVLDRGTVKQGLAKVKRRVGTSDFNRFKGKVKSF